MTNISASLPTFESRLVSQSREYEDPAGNLSYEHNSWLEIGEKVMFAGGQTELTVVKSRYRNPLTRLDLVTVAVPQKDGSEENVEVAVSAVRRVT
jgi:hypothetical protein